MNFVHIGAGAGDKDPSSGFRDGFSEYVKNHKSKTKKTRRLILLFLFALLLIQANYGALPLWLGNSLLITAIVVITFLLIFSRGDL